MMLKHIRKIFFMLRFSMHGRLCIENHRIKGNISLYAAGQLCDLTLHTDFSCEKWKSADNSYILQNFTVKS